jgi:Tol biopolymer transport system component
MQETKDLDARHGMRLDRGLVATALVAVGTVIVSGITIASDRVPDEIARRPSNAASLSAPQASPGPMVAPRRFHRAEASIVNLRTGKAKRLSLRVRAFAYPTQFAASPDGGRLAYTDDRAIYVCRIDGRHGHTVVDGQGLSAPDWSPDGRRIVYSDGAQIYVVNVRTRRVSRVTDLPKAKWIPLLVHPNFSPDGRTILFTMATRAHRLDLWTVAAKGGDTTRLLRLHRQTHAAFGTYGPDGTIAYRRTGFDGSDPTEMTADRVWIAEPDGSPGRAVGRARSWMSQVDPERLWPAWSPDGTKIAFERLYGSAVVVVDIRSGRTRRVGDGVNPTWLDNNRLIIERFSKRRAK